MSPDLQTGATSAPPSLLSLGAAQAAVTALIEGRHRLIRWANDLAGELGLDLRRAGDRAAFIDLLEAPACTCPRVPVPCRCAEPCECPLYIPPCEHLRRANNGLDFASWAYLLRFLDQRGYDPTLTTAAAEPALTRTARVDRLRKRRRLKQRLFDGALQLPRGVARQGGHERNGRDIADEALIATRGGDA